WKRHVLLAVAQRRHEYRNHAETEVQIFAEASGANLRLQILVRRGEDANVDLDPVRAAHGLERLLLQDAQHLRLRLDAHVADLVEEQRSPVGQLELAAPIRDRAGERPADVAEQLALD